jgi:hypothetical protein
MPTMIAAALFLIGAVGAQAQESLPQTPIAAAALVFCYLVPGMFPPEWLHVTDENSVHLHGTHDEAEFIRKSDCIYRVEVSGSSTKGEIDFSNLQNYERRGDNFLRLSGGPHLWCSNFGGSGLCFNYMDLKLGGVEYVRRRNLSQLTAAIQFIQGVCPSQVPF